VSLIVTVPVSATISPAVESILNSTLKLSAPSVVKSLASVSVKLPLSAVIATEPPFVTALAGLLKSELLIVPLTAAIVQYKVPAPKFSVVTDTVTTLPSFTEEGLATTAYVTSPTADCVPYRSKILAMFYTLLLFIMLLNYQPESIHRFQFLVKLHSRIAP